MPLHSSKQGRVRWILAAISFGILLISAIYISYKIHITSPYRGLEDITFNELTGESIKSNVEFSRSLFQVGLLITGGLWGLIIAKKDEAGIVLKDKPEVIMFTCASLLLITSLICHSLYLSYVSYIYFLGGKTFSLQHPTIPDIFDPNINNLFIYQIWCLVFGFLIAIVTLFSAHKLKEV